MSTNFVPGLWSPFILNTAWKTIELDTRGACCASCVLPMDLIKNQIIIFVPIEDCSCKDMLFFDISTRCLVKICHRRMFQNLAVETHRVAFAGGERLVIYRQTTSVSAAHASHCATYCTPCRPLIRAFSGWIRTPPPTIALIRSHTLIRPYSPLLWSRATCSRATWTAEDRVAV